MIFLAILLQLTQLVGGEFIHTVKSGDSLTSIGARFGVDVSVLAEVNGLKPSSRLQIAQTLKINNQHIAPPANGAALIINIPQRMLFHFVDGELLHAFPIAAGQPGWKTPLGDFTVVTVEENPTWDVPPSIQEEMRRSGKPVVTKVPPSPDNPLGEYWIGLSMPGIGIHGTNAPASIYKLVTHGCIRVHPDLIEDLFHEIEPGIKGRIIYKPTLVTRIGSSVFVESHPDAYKKESDPMAGVLDKARREGFLNLMDVAVVKETIRKHEGVARNVTRQ